MDFILGFAAGSVLVALIFLWPLLLPSKEKPPKPPSFTVR